MAAADIGLAPTRLDRFTAMTLSTKVYEYAAMGKPVVASRLPLVERTFPEGTVAAYEPGDAEGMAAAILCPRRRSARSARRRSRGCGTWSAMRPGSARRSATWRSSSDSRRP